MSFKVSWKLHIVCFLLAYAFCYIEQNRISDLFVSLLSQNELIDFTGNTLMYLIIFLIVIFIPITFVHELLHGAVYKLFGGKIRFGFKGCYVWCEDKNLSNYFKERLNSFSRQIGIKEIEENQLLVDENALV
ncbi:hypothetical protein [Clostridium sp. YIM B02569]|uniref:hypothetical protein n=1 Tax=Clostridium sp. YIM B02569 TaxID=2911967 RepID=UPI001EEA00B5|nr:hypothetical protein [Clostridium sp. YIM B02569]